MLTNDQKKNMYKIPIGNEPWNKGKSGLLSEESRTKIARAAIGNKNMLGKKHSEQTK